MRCDAGCWRSAAALLGLIPAVAAALPAGLGSRRLHAHLSPELLVRCSSLALAATAYWLWLSGRRTWAVGMLAGGPDSCWLQAWSGPPIPFWIK